MIELIGWSCFGLSVIGTIVNIYKSKWGFFFWGASSLGFMGIAIYQITYSQAAMFALDLAMCSYGFWFWSRSLKVLRKAHSRKKVKK